MTQSIARPLCDSWAFCPSQSFWQTHRKILRQRQRLGSVWSRGIPLIWGPRVSPWKYVNFGCKAMQSVVIFASLSVEILVTWQILFQLEAKGAQGTPPSSPPMFVKNVFAWFPSSYENSVTQRNAPQAFFVRRTRREKQSVTQELAAASSMLPAFRRQLGSCVISYNYVRIP